MSYDVTDVGNACVRTLSKLDYSSNNVANVNTPGFKAEYLNYSVEKSSPTTSDKVPSYAQSLFTDYSQGTLQRTDNSLDFAIQGEGFFVLQSDNGIAYTRKGDFTLNEKSELVTKSGDYVLGKSGKIILDGKDIHVDQSGSIQVDGNQVDSLKIVSFENPEVLIHKGEGVFKDNGNGVVKKDFTPNVLNESLEASNVSAIKEMIQMIDIQRTFETYQKLIHTISDQDKLSTGRIGKLV
ncbi:flagellar basal-body rod protein FlgG [Syntrophus gentianae]|uniref:Flagellar basal-body rod protein FlgG n=1 Tax=Syntrophus gentianae TaxID=43775 RepID=A0A1H7XP82_9BACT|nr:flagellar basal-body rod protein FlgF [Syntrophus gentianae]SEM35600.1 flagellar basal-body rod protein FlgG [Syntrophus gentianae]